MTSGEGRSSLWVPARNDFKGNFLTHTRIHILVLTHVLTHVQTHTHRDTHSHNPRGLLHYSLGHLVRGGKHLPLLMQGLICAENVCLCKESKKIIVTAYVTGVD